MSKLKLLLLGLLASFATLSTAALADDTPAAAPSASAAPAPLPPYFSGANAEGKPATWPDPTGAASGVWATPAGDGKGDTPATLGTTDVYDRVTHNMFSINMVWTLITGFLVMFMQAGFAMVETGMCRAKNAGHTIAMNFMIYPLGCLGFWAYGFALGWGNWFNGPVAPGWYSSLGPGTAVLNSGISIAGKFGIMGTKGFFLGASVGDTAVMALFFFMMVFMDTTATIPTGAMAERWAWKNFVIYGLWIALPYCLYANWVWGGGFLAQGGLNWHLGHGAVDFAGSGVVHAMGGVIALAGGICIGPRLGKYKDGKPQPMPGHDLPMAVIGCFILAFGWFGFNPGSTLSGTDLRISYVVVNTMLASVAGAFSSMLYLMSTGSKKPDPGMMVNGMLAGLVAITAPCAFVDPWAAVVIGLISGVLVVWAAVFIENKGVDDPVGAVAVHGVNGLWGVISVGIFSNGQYGAGWGGVVRDEYVKQFGSDGVRGILYGDASQLVMQLIDAAVVAVFGFVMAYVWFKISDKITPLRVSKETELAGLDIPEMGAHGYPGFKLNEEA